MAERSARAPAETRQRPIGQRIEQARKALSIRLTRPVSQTEMAELMTAEMHRRGTLKPSNRVDQTKISRFETGRQTPTIEEFEALEAITGTPAAYLAFSSGEPDTPSGPPPRDR
jgi:hypothetical protein